MILVRGFWHTGVAKHWYLSKLQGETVITTNLLRLPSSRGERRYRAAESELGVLIRMRLGFSQIPSSIPLQDYISDKIFIGDGV